MVRQAWPYADRTRLALFGYLSRRNDTRATTLEPHALEAARRTIGPAGWVAGRHG